MLTSGFADPTLTIDLTTLKIQEADQVLLLMRQLPQEVILHVQLHGFMDTFANLVKTLRNYDLQTRTFDMAKVHAFGPGKGKGKKGSSNEKGKSKGKGNSEKGKSKGDGKSGKKGKSKPSSRSSSTDSKKSKGKGSKPKTCWNCGKEGHFKENCPEKKDGDKKSQKGSVSSVTSQEEDYQSEILGCLTAHRCTAATLEDFAVFQFDREDELRAIFGTAELSPCSVSMEGRTEMLRSSVNSPGMNSWLVDSGATSHIMSYRNQGLFEVVREYKATCELKAANGNQIDVAGIADVAVNFTSQPGRKQRVVLQHVIIALIDFNVLSPWVLCQRDWLVHLAKGSEASLKYRRLSFPLFTFQRGWWIDCQTSGSQRSPRRSGSKGKSSGSEAMEVDAVGTSEGCSLKVDGVVVFPSVPSVSSISNAATSASAPVLKSSLKKPNLETTVRNDVQMESSGLTFLIREVDFDDSVIGFELRDLNLPDAPLSEENSQTFTCVCALGVKANENETFFESCLLLGFSDLWHGAQRSQDPVFLCFQKMPCSFTNSSLNESPCFESTLMEDVDQEPGHPGSKEGITRLAGSATLRVLGSSLKESSDTLKFSDALEDFSDVCSDLSSSCSHTLSSGQSLEEGMQSQSPSFAGPSIALSEREVDESQNFGRSLHKWLSEGSCSLSLGNQETVFDESISGSSEDFGSSVDFSEFESCLEDFCNTEDENTEFFECPEWFAMDDGDSDMEDHPLPDPEVELSDAEPSEPLPSDQNPIDDLEDSADLELEKDELYLHISRGHQPFLKSCEACSRSAGRIPARRVKHPKGPFEVAMDIAYLGPLRILVLVVLCTSMMGSFCLTGEVEKDCRTLNNWFRELGLTGHACELTIDGEKRLESLVRNAMSLDNRTLSSVHFLNTPPNRSQSNGKAERHIGLMKRSLVSNLLFVESQVQRRIPLESSLLTHLVPFVARTYNLHHVPQGCIATPMEKMRNRVGCKRIKTYPFGATILAKPTESGRSHELENLTHIVYLGPVSCLGGGLWGIPAGPSRVGLSLEDSLKIRKYQVARVESPLVWDLEPLIAGAPVNLNVPKKNLDFPGEPERADYKPEPPLEASPADKEIKVPSSGPPRSWIDAHGPTPGCYGCDGIVKKGSVHARNHSKRCKERYKHYLEDEQKKSSVPPISSSSSKPSEIENGKRPADFHPTGGRRRRTKGPEFKPPDPPPVGAEPMDMGDDYSPDDDPLPGPMNRPPVPMSDVDPGELPIDVDMEEHVPPMEPMEMDVMINEMVDANVLRFLHGLEQSFAGGKWYRMALCGMVFFQQVREGVKCETTGEVLDVQKVVDGMRLECTSLTKLNVGVCLPESQIHKLSKQLKLKVISTRWVIVKKSNGIVRCRLVAKDFKHLGQSALKEGFYSPTSSIESLRVVLAIGETCLRLQYGNMWAMVSLDVSTAFLYASLRKGERVLVMLPNSSRCLNAESKSQGFSDESSELWDLTSSSKLGMDLNKALYGLRKAPLLWYREIRATLLELNFQLTSDPTVFRYEDSDSGGILLLLLYVDDTLLIGRLELIDKLLLQLEERYSIKETGRMTGCYPGTLSFLGREIKRECEGGPLLMGVNSTYYDGIEEASGLSLTAKDKLPDLAKYVEDPKDMIFLDRDDAEVYRSCLGKLSWLAVSNPSILFAVGWLSSYQQKPTVRSWEALKGVLRYTKSLRGIMQKFPAVDTPMGLMELVGTVDASWGVKSTMGGYLHWNGCFLKGWSRRVAVTCLSSAESELFSLVEGLKEGLGTAMIVETTLYGLPDRTKNGFLEREEGFFKIILKTDSTSALSIALMNGLLRRVRHLELRVLVLQEHTDSGRLEVRFVPGSSNGSDALTKSGDSTHQPLLIAECGLVHPENVGKIQNWIESILDRWKLSGQNKSRIREGVGILFRKVGLISSSDRDHDPSCSEHVVKRAETDVPVKTSETSRHVSFNENVEIFGIKSRNMPKKFAKILRDYPHLETFRNALYEFFAGSQLFIEVCCRRDSGFAHVCQLKGFSYLGVTEDIDLCNPGTMLLIRNLVDCGKGVITIWVSTPCTAGCRWRYLNLKMHKHFFELWKQKYRLHCRLWQRIKTTLKDVASKALIVQEWPRGNCLWSDKVYERCAKPLMLKRQNCFVRRCCLDNIKKCWELACNRDRFFQMFEPQEECACQSFRKVNTHETGIYSKEVCEFFLRQVLRCLGSDGVFSRFVEGSGSEEGSDLSSQSSSEREVSSDEFLQTCGFGGTLRTLETFGMSSCSSSLAQSWVEGHVDSRSCYDFRRVFSRNHFLDLENKLTSFPLAMSHSMRSSAGSGAAGSGAALGSHDGNAADEAEEIPWILEGSEEEWSVVSSVSQSSWTAEQVESMRQQAEIKDREKSKRGRRLDTPTEDMDFDFSDGGL